ncbi:MAG: hypothetical protein WC569_06970 [Candidatus Omnitrophota bacterium]
MKRKKPTKKKVSKAGKKPAAKKKAVKRPKKKSAAAKKKTAARKRTSLPEGASLEEVGIVTHYFPKVDAAVVKLAKGVLSVGDKIFIKGHTSDFIESIESMQLDHEPIQTAEKGQEIGLKVKSKVREHDVIYRIVG